MVIRKSAIAFISLFCGTLLLCSGAPVVPSETFSIVLANEQPDYFRFVSPVSPDSGDGDVSYKEIDSRGITFSFPDKALTSTTEFYIDYNIKSNSTLTLYRTSSTAVNPAGMGFMLLHENGKDGLNYDIKSMNGNILVPSIPQDSISSEIAYEDYKVVIVDSPAKGTEGFRLILSPPMWEGGANYMEGVYTGYLTLKLTSNS